MVQVMRNKSRESVAVSPRVSVHKSLVKKLQSRPKSSVFMRHTPSVQACVSIVREAKIVKIRGIRRRCSDGRLTAVTSPRCL